MFHRGFEHDQISDERPSTLKMINCALKMIDLLSAHKLTSIQYLTFHVVFNKALRVSKARGVGKAGQAS